MITELLNSSSTSTSNLSNLSNHPAFSTLPPQRLHVRRFGVRGWVLLRPQSSVQQVLGDGMPNELHRQPKPSVWRSQPAVRLQAEAEPGIRQAPWVWCYATAKMQPTHPPPYGAPRGALSHTDSTLVQGFPNRDLPKQPGKPLHKPTKKCQLLEGFFLLLFAIQ